MTSVALLPAEWVREQADRANRMQLCTRCGAPYDAGAYGFIVHERRKPSLLFLPDARCQVCAPERFR